MILFEKHEGRSWTSKKIMGNLDVLLELSWISLLSATETKRKEIKKTNEINTIFFPAVGTMSSQKGKAEGVIEAETQ